MNQGWFKLHRALKDKAIWNTSNAVQKVILITILLLANHTKNEWEFGGEKFTCEPGQFVTSINSLAEACGKDVSTQNVRTALKRFEKLEFLTNQSTKTGRLITVVNWEKYQDCDNEPNKGINKDLTKTSQRPNKDLTPNKNERMKNERMKEVREFKAPTPEDVIGYCREKGLKVDAQRFVDFYESKGWMIGKNKMKDWKAACRNWARQETGSERTSVKKKPFPQREYDQEQMKNIEKDLLGF